MKVEKAMESVNRVARRSNEPGLRRVSQDLNLVRNSIKLARASMGSTGARLRPAAVPASQWTCVYAVLSWTVGATAVLSAQHTDS